MESDDTRKFDEFDDLLSRYLKGQLSEEEEAEFHRLISDDAELRNKAVATARLARAMAQAGPQRDHAIIDAIKTLTLDQAEDLAEQTCEMNPFPIGRHASLQIRACLTTERPMSLKTKAVRWAVAAAIAICLFGAYRLFIYEPPQVSPSIQSEILAMLSEPQIIRGDNDSIGMRLDNLCCIIARRQQSDRVIGELEDMWNKSRRDTYNDCTEYMPDIGLLLACAYINNRSYDQAFDVLDSLLADYPSGTAVGDKALAIKEKINEFLSSSHL